MQVRGGKIITATLSSPRGRPLGFSFSPFLPSPCSTPIRSPLSSAQETLLEKQEITREASAPLLRDVDTMLDLVGEEGLRVSESRGAIYARRLPEINERLTHSLTADYERLTQKAFPTIAGLNLLLQAAALVRIDRTGTHPRMVCNEDIVASWHALTSTEQYMSLLEAAQPGGRGGHL